MGWRHPRAVPRAPDGAAHETLAALSPCCWRRLRVDGPALCPAGAAGPRHPGRRATHICGRAKPRCRRSPTSDIFRDRRLQALIGKRSPTTAICGSLPPTSPRRGSNIVSCAPSSFPKSMQARGDVTGTARLRHRRQDYTGRRGRAELRARSVRPDPLADRGPAQPYLATEAAARATRLTLVGDVANAWLVYAADASLMKIAEDTAANAEKSVRLTRLRLEGGIAPRTDLRQAEQILDRPAPISPTRRTALAQDVNLLQLLVGAPIDRRCCRSRSTRPCPPSPSCRPG